MRWLFLQGERQKAFPQKRHEIGDRVILRHGSVERKTFLYPLYPQTQALQLTQLFKACTSFLW